MPLFADLDGQAWSLIIAAICGIAYAALNYFGVQIPPIVLKIIGIVLVAALAIIAVRFLLSL